VEHLDLFLAQLAVIFLPGIVWARLDSRYAGKEASEIDFFIRAFVYGVAAYVATFALYALLGRDFSVIDFKQAQESNVFTAKIVGEIFSATAVGFFLGVGWVFSVNHKWLTRFLQFIRATKRYGDEDVWDYTFNSNSAAVEYVHFRDFDQRLVYAGWVNTFSESGKIRELVLRDVEVYDFEGQLQYEVPLMYVARRTEDIHVEFPLP
jgi:hypothetical protein